jgi:predicted nucleotide-binding protein (sugar kinase/HSP70/actin superfamily)
MSIRRYMKERKFLAAAKDALKRFFQLRIENRYAGPYKKYLRTLHEPSTGQILKLSAPYIPDTLEGEAVLSIGKSVDHARRGASGIINAIPFGCMPGIIVAGVMQTVKREYDIPFITIPYEGTESSTNAMQLEAFMDQARSKAMYQNGST